MKTSYLDLAPFRRSTVGFDRLFDAMNRSAPEGPDGYPPFDIEKEADDRYRITLALAGFRPEDIEMVSHENVLTITGRADKGQEDPGRYIHRGIAARAFER